MLTLQAALESSLVVVLGVWELKAAVRRDPDQLLASLVPDW